MEVVGIPCQVDDKHLEAKVLSIFLKVGCTIAPEFIDDCHRLGKKTTESLLNLLVGRTANKYFKSRKT